MKVLGVFIFAGLLLIPVFYAAFWAGVRTGAKRVTTTKIRLLGFTPESAGRYIEAMRLLNRMVRVTELDGQFAADMLSDQTRADIEQIVNAYRKEITA